MPRPLSACARSVELDPAAGPRRPRSSGSAHTQGAVLSVTIREGRIVECGACSRRWTTRVIALKRVRVGPLTLDVCRGAVARADRRGSGGAAPDETGTICGGKFSVDRGKSAEKE